MLDQLQHAKVCDFGLSRPFTINKDDPGGKAFLELSSSKFDGSTCAIGTLRYVAPEVLQCTEEQVTVRFNEFSDVYSFGILLWELSHRETPFAGHDGVQACYLASTPAFRWRRFPRVCYLFTTPLSLQVAVKVAPSGQRPLMQLPAGLSVLGRSSI